MAQVYPNTLNLPEHLIQRRITKLDPDAKIIFYRMASNIEQSHVSVESTELLPEEVEEILGTDLTEAELAAIDRKKNAFAQAVSVSELKSITPAEASAYIDANVTDLQSAKGVLKIMARMIILMRNELWPNLPEEN